MSIAITFWDFSLATYGRDGVPPACLALQDEYGLDINVLLFCCWAAINGHALTDDELKQVLQLSSSWADAVVRPLRSTRRWMKRKPGDLPEFDFDRAMALREQIKHVELKAEQLQQLALESLYGKFKQTGPHEGSPRETMSGNVRRYLEHADVELVLPVTTRIDIVIDAALAAA